MTSETDKTNYTRLSRLLLDVGTEIYRKKFKSRYPSVSKYGHILRIVKGKIYGLLNRGQKEILFPEHGEYDGNLDDLDISVLYILLRNIGNLPPPISCDWGKDPYDSDRSVAANIERIHQIRNIVFGHRAAAAIGETEFQVTWQRLKLALMELGAEERFIDELLVTPIDPEMEQNYITRISKMGDEYAKLVEKIDTLEEEGERITQNVTYLQQERIETNKRVESLEGDFKKIKLTDETRRNEKKNLNDLQEKDIKRWRQKIKRFIITTSAKNALQKVQNYQVVIISGSSGSGKTTTAFYVAFTLESDEEYNINCGKHPRDIICMSDSKKKQIFILDDVFGKTDLNPYTVNEWSSYSTMLRGLLEINPYLRFIFVCRSEAIQNKVLESISPTKHQECSISLSPKERRLIGHAYLPDEIITKLDDETLQLYPFLPLLYEIYSTRKGTNLTRFFKFPYEVIHEELKAMQDLGSRTFIALALLVILDNNVRKEMFEAGSKLHKDILKCIHEESGYSEKPTKALLLRHFQTLQDSYVTETADSFICIHDRMFDIIAKYFGEQLPYSVLTHGTKDFISTRILFQSVKFDFSAPEYILLPEKHELRYFDRMVAEIKKGNYIDVFGNTQSKNASYRSKFVSFMSNYPEKLCLIPKDSSCLNALVVSCIKGYLEYVKFILAYSTEYTKGEYLNMKTNLHDTWKDWTPLHFSCSWGHQDITSVLIELSARVNEVDYKNRSPLHLACMRGQEAVAKLLLEKGADAIRSDCQGYTPLHYASLSGCENLVKMLIKSGPVINNINNYGFSPLHMVCTGAVYIKFPVNSDTLGQELNHDFGKEIKVDNLGLKVNTRIIECLLKNKADVNQTMPFGLSALHISSKLGLEDFVEVLLKYGAAVNMVSDAGITPLHLACKQRNYKTVELLLKNGADVNVRTKQEQTPLAIACAKRHENVANLVLTYLRKK